MLKRLKKFWEDLKEEIFSRSQKQQEMERQLHTCIEEIHKLRAENEFLQSLVMKLRVENSDPESKGRIGWQVSSFIPQAVIEKIRNDPADFDNLVNHVAKVLVDGALRGIFRINHKGFTALVWEPLSMDSSHRVLTGWYEGSKRPDMIFDSRESTRSLPQLSEPDLTKLLF